MADLLVIVPTRERSPSLARFTAAANRTMSGVAELLFVFDDDDPLLEDNKQAAGDWNYMVLPRHRLVPKINIPAMQNVNSYPVIMFLADDMLPITPGWDAAIVKAIADMGGSGFAYPNDLQRSDVPQHVAVSSDIIRALGWMANPAMNHFYIDNAWAVLGHEAGCITYLEDVVMEHLHWTLGKAPKDHVNTRAIARGDADAQAFETWRATKADEDIATVRRVVYGETT